MLRKTLSVETKRLRIVLQPDEKLEEIVASTEDIEHLRLCEAILDSCRSEPKNRKWAMFWTVYFKDTGVELGNLRFLGAPLMGAVEIVNEIDQRFYGNGVVTEAIEAMTKWAFAQDGVYVVYDEIASYDVLSKNGLNSLGYTECGIGYEGIRYRKLKPKEYSLLIFSIIGIIIGLIFGRLVDRILYGVGIGLGFGAIAGASMQLMDYHSRDKACGEDTYFEDVSLIAET